MGLASATFAYSEVERIDKDKLDKIEAYLRELRGLHRKYPEKEVREKLAVGLVNATKYYRRANRLDKIYNTLPLLYKLRFDLPEDQDKEKRIKIIEDLFMGVTKGIIEEKIYDDNKQLEDFLNLLKAEIGDTEVVLLMNKISEKLDIKIQKKLWEMLRL